MQVMELYNPNAVPDGWHEIRSPGGYEWWYFDAEDPSTDRQVVVIFMEGFIFHPGYLRAHNRYLRNPTRHAPVFPNAFPCTYLAVYEKGKLLWQVMEQHPPGAFCASSYETRVSIGPSTLGTEGRDYVVELKGTPWDLTWRGPQHRTGTTVRAQLRFRPRFDAEPSEREFFSRQMTGALHRWVVASPVCAVEGRIWVASEKGETSISFEGNGYHDHNYGLAPIGEGLSRWVWGRAFAHEAAFTFHHAVPRDKLRKPESHLLLAHSQGIRETDPAGVRVDWTGRSALGLSYPREIELGERLRLRSPRVVDSTPFYLRLTYAAEGVPGVQGAFCEVAHPHRLRWPVLGRMIEMSILRK
jgi:carotenoid 1,2-hydratase